MLAVIKSCEGRHRSISDVVPEGDCFVVGCIIEEKRGSKALDLKKFILSEVLPDGGAGKNFAIFVFGVKSRLSTKLNDVFVIHNPNITKSHLINHMNLLYHKYEYQIIIHLDDIKVHHIASEDKQVIELKELEKLQLTESNKQGKENGSQSSASPSCKRKHHPEELPEKNKSENYIKKIKVNDLKKYTCSYTKLCDVNSSSGTIKVIGIIRSVVKGTQSADGEGLMKIFLRDESITRSKFQLNLLSNVVDIPPLHCGYILKARNVWIQKMGEEVTGWVSNGKFIATVESDIEKPITLLSTQTDPDLTDEDRTRINELREFINQNESNNAISSESEKSTSDSEEKQSSQLTKNRQDEPEDNCSFTLHLSSSDESCHAQDQEEVLEVRKHAANSK